ncbi:MAG: flagellar biosynthesis protein FlgB [Planctomycetaceae bacterium]|nr:MAG: flagellar biosynthesis protein FlgB [Planctomycetaceae bacterium]
MIQQLWNQTSIPWLRQVARFTERRQEVLAGNIANIDTPGYRQRDLPVEAFRETLRRLMVARSSLRIPQPTPYAWNTALVTLSGPSELTPLSGPTTDRPTHAAAVDIPPELFHSIVVEPDRQLTFQDGANRQIETLMAQMTQNMLWQHYTLELLKQQYDQLQWVIQGKI